MRYEFNLDLNPVWHKSKKVPGEMKEPNLRLALTLAHQIAEYMRDNRVKSMTEFCAFANISPARATQILRLLCLSPKIQEQILLAPKSMRLYRVSEHKIRDITKEIVWEKQEALWTRYKIG